jgi:hypothetical protein
VLLLNGGGYEVIKTLATVFGVVFLLVGVLGFVPGITNDSQMLLGIFHVNAVHNIIHLLSGAFALYAGMTSMDYAKLYFRIFGVVYLLVAILGFYYGDKDVLGFISSNMADTWLHVVIAVVALYAGFAAMDDGMKAPMAS